MKLLLDTHTFLWFIEGDARLSPTAKDAIEDGDNDVYLIIGSLWEMAIKISLGKLSISQPFETYIPAQLAANNFELLPISVDHTASLTALQFPIETRLIACSLLRHWSPI